MDHFLDLRFLPDESFSLNVLLSAFYEKFHRNLCEQPRQVGMTFPKYKQSTNPRRGTKTTYVLGGCIRLIGSQQDLNELREAKWLGGIRDNLMVGKVNRVPTDITGFVNVRRVQPPTASKVRREIRRCVERLSMTEEEAIAKVSGLSSNLSPLPFIQMHSRSTGHNYRLFIEQTPADSSVPGEFNTFAISTIASLPIW